LLLTHLTADFERAFFAIWIWMWMPRRISKKESIGKALDHCVLCIHSDAINSLFEIIGDAYSDAYQSL